MRINALKVNGFGLFCDQRVERMPTDLCVFFGENEAGKSTLLGFIRSILFGFPSDKEKRNKYEPLRGGTYGGSLRLVLDAGDGYTVTREPSRKVAGEASIMRDDGAAFGEEFMSKLLGATTRDLFESVFAFSLAELQELSRLTGENVKGVIYSAGAGSVRRPLPQIHANLEKRMGDIFKKGGSKPEINKILKELDDVGKRLREIGGASLRYDELQCELGSLEGEIAGAERESGSLKLKSKVAENKLGAWDDWTALESARLELKSLPPVESFPDNGSAQLDRLQEALSSVRQQHANVERKQSARSTELAAITLDEALIANSRAIRRLQKGRDSYDNAIADLPGLRQELTNKQKQLAKALSDLGPEWDAGKLASIDVSVPRRGAIRQHEERLKESRESEGRSQVRVDGALRLAEDAQKELEAAEERLRLLREPAEKDETPISARIAHLKQAEKHFAKSLRLGDLLKNLTERRGDLEARLLPPDARTSSAFQRLPAWLSFLIPVAGIAAATLLFKQNPALAVVLAVAAIAAGYALFQVWRRSREAPGISEQAARIEARLSGVQQEQKIAEKELDDVTANMRQNLSFVGLNDNVSEVALQEELARAERDLDECRAWCQGTSELEKARKAAGDAKTALESAMAQQQEAVSASASQKKLWARWLADAGLSEDLTPSGALDVFSRVEACRVIDESVQGLVGRIAAIEAEIRKYREDVERVAKNCGRSLSGDDDPGASLDRLADQLQLAEEAARRRKGLEEAISELALEVDASLAQITELTDNVAALLKAGGAADEHEFRQRGEWHGKRLNLEGETTRRIASLQRIVGPDRLEQFLDALRSSVKEELEVESENLAQQLERLGEQLKDAYDKRGSLKKEIEQQEAEEESSSLRLQRQQLIARLQGLAREWCVLRLSREILRRAREVYERERQPNVVREASALFESITEGRYAGIVKPLGEETFEVRGQNQERLTIDQLSQGTKEQLFLAVRLGLVKEFGRLQEKLPLIMDDVLVNFDRRRARATAKVLHEVSATHQVLLFTCHQETLDLVRDVAPGTRIFTLADGVIAERTSL
ncbi:MAG: AAA family ATPase [Candidatus Coatesbacteria bacterium]|nr:AAA family ATPase [Candidatus Coatesbacteria bacterium]